MKIVSASVTHHVLYSWWPQSQCSCLLLHLKLFWSKAHNVRVHTGRLVSICSWERTSTSALFCYLAEMAVSCGTTCGILQIKTNITEHHHIEHRSLQLATFDQQNTAHSITCFRKDTAFCQCHLWTHHYPCDCSASHIFCCTVRNSWSIDLCCILKTSAVSWMLEVAQELESIKLTDVYQLQHQCQLNSTIWWVTVMISH